MNGLDDAVKGASDVPRKIPGDTKSVDGKLGCRWAEEDLRGSPANPTAVTSEDKKIKRYPDVFNEFVLEAKEAKTGYVRFSKSIENEIRNDVNLINDGEFRKIEWHFFPSGRSNTLGGDPRVFEMLKQNKIPYIIHIP